MKLARRLVAFLMASASSVTVGLVAQAPADSRRGATLSEAALLEATIPELQRQMASGRLTARQLVELYLARIEAYDDRGPGLNAINSISRLAPIEADALDAERRAQGPRGPLHGIPIIVKDNYHTREMPTTAGSILLASWTPPDEAFIVSRLRGAGAIILGKSNMHEFAYGIESVGSLFGQIRNPYALDRNPGGSSGGTGAAIAAGFGAAGLGSDTCGSIRLPAAHNNLAGLRPTQGLTSRSGIVPLAHTQDIGGPITRSITDLAVMLDAIAGYDPSDAVTAESRGHIPKSYAAFLDAGSLQGARIGVLVDLFGSEPEDAEVATIVRAALDQMRRQGATLIDVSIPNLAALLKDSSVIREEFKFDLAAHLSRDPDAPIKSLQDVISSGKAHPALAERLANSQKVESLDTREYLERLVRRATIRRAALAAMADHDVVALAYPPIRRKAARAGETQAGNNCALSATSGLPAIAVPAGFTVDGLPVGVELLGRTFDEPTLIRLAFAFEQATRHRRLPASTPAIGR